MAVRRRASVALAAAALVTPLLTLPASPAFAAGEDTPPPPRSVSDLCANVPADFDPFVDDSGNVFEQNIECLAFAEITQGQSGGNTYGPGGVVRRDQMASFVARLIDTADELDTGDDIATLPAFDGEVDFTDVPSGNVHRQNIDRLAEAGVVSGGPGGRPTTQYGPELEVTRAQMASFIRNALAFMSGEQISTDQDFFTDDENATPHEPRINAVAALGIAVGNGQDSYNPSASVTRGQLAGFLTRTLAVLEDAEQIRPVGEDADPQPQVPDTAVTDAPDLIAAEPAADMSEDTAIVTFTFDEEVTAGEIDSGSFLVYAFDGEQHVADSAAQDRDDPTSVRARFLLTDDQLAEITVATVDAGAVEDADGNPNPIGDVPFGGGVTLAAGQTTAPDLVSIGGFSSTATATATTVEFTFDQEAFLVDPTTGQFEIVLSDGTDLEGTPADDGDGDVTGDGTETITVEFPGTVEAGDVARGVVLQGTVSSEEQVGSSNPLTGNPVEGDLNPLQVTDADAGGTTTAPDLVSATVDAEAGQVTYTFDENVAVEDASRFHVYDSDAQQLDGDEAAAEDADGDRTVVITFAAGDLNAVVAASVEDGAVTQTASGARPNQEDEVGVTPAAFAEGVTVGPDLLEATRESVEGGITVRFTFDDEAGAPAGGSFFVVSETGEQTALRDCAQSETEGEENVVECFATSTNNPLTPTVDESAAFRAAGDAVLATVDDGAVTDDEGDASPEGAALLEDA